MQDSRVSGTTKLPLMSIQLFLSTVVSLMGAHADTARRPEPIETPTVLMTPVVGIRSRLVADSIVVEKSRRRLTLYQGGFPVRIYRVALGKQPTGDKVSKGDNRTPEGLFFIDSRNPVSKYHRSLHISYPDAAHIQRAMSRGVRAGGDIMLHGLPRGFEDVGAGHRDFDWTEGCIALTNAEIDEIWAAIPNGAPIQIRP
jgi:murein L,D-transpeptidase YafK